MAEWWLFRRRIIGLQQGLVKRLGLEATLSSLYALESVETPEVSEVAALASVYAVAAVVSPLIAETATVSSAYAIEQSLGLPIVETALIASLYAMESIETPLAAEVPVISSVYSLAKIETPRVSEVATVGSVYALLTSEPPAPTWGDDNFDDDELSNVWSTVTAGTGSVAETNQRLEVTGPANNDIAGIVSAEAHDIDGKYVEIDVTQLDNVNSGELLISLTKATSGNPYFMNDWYRIIKYRGPNQWYVQKSKGGSKSTLGNAAWASSTGKLRIYHDGTTVHFYENGVEKVSETWDLASTTVYIYVYSAMFTGYLGTDHFDDFLTDTE